MIVQAQPRELIITCLNSYANFNLAYWNYADPGKIIRFWVGYRERAEFLISEMEESDEKEEMTANNTCAVQILLVALSRRICCSLVCKASLNEAFPSASID